jgi:hypothetical protein
MCAYNRGNKNKPTHGRYNGKKIFIYKKKTVNWVIAHSSLIKRTCSNCYGKIIVNIDAYAFKEAQNEDIFRH